MTGNMDNQKLTDEQKTRLLSLAIEAHTSDALDNTDDEKGDLLCDLLRCPLPATDHTGAVPKAIPPGYDLAFGLSLGQLLTDPETDIVVLRQIKEYAKSLGGHATGELEKDVLLAVYFAAIAGALVFRHESITEHTEHDLSRFFAKFAAVPWMRLDLRRLFVQATEYC